MLIIITIALRVAFEYNHGSEHDFNSDFEGLLLPKLGGCAPGPQSVKSPQPVVHSVVPKAP